MPLQSVTQNLNGGLFAGMQNEALSKLVSAMREAFLFGSATYDAANLVDGAGATSTITVTGAALGDLVLVSCGVDLQGITLTGYVSAANTVSFRLQNESGGPIDLASTTYRAVVLKASYFTSTYQLGLAA